MTTGLLWYDSHAAHDLMKTIDDAAARYQEKYGIVPDTCFVNRAQLKEFALGHRDALPKTINLAVLPKDTIFKNHVWVVVSKQRGA